MGSEGGIFPAIIGSVYLGILAVIFASSLALATSLYIVFYGKNEMIKSFMRFTISLIAGIPSIILGLFGYSFLVVSLRFNISLFTGGIVLGVMIFPFIEVRFEKAFLEVSRELWEASCAMGVNKVYTILKLIIPVCFKNIMSIVSLAGSFAMGAAAPILFSGGVFYAPVSDSIFSPVMALPLHLYILIGEGISLENAYGTAVVLVLILLVLNTCAILLGLWKGKK
ncbi:PstA family ABC transporter permease [Phosphitispora sp. TUW77]|uniref:PstA family ABC transporter permease n=1 Tax=Phosphitispora sp. TUW77 TaxID=3152361 RepID=UPI003AB5965E